MVAVEGMARSHGGGYSLSFTNTRKGWLKTLIHNLSYAYMISFFRSLGLTTRRDFSTGLTRRTSPSTWEACRRDPFWMTSGHGVTRCSATGSEWTSRSSRPGNGCSQCFTLELCRFALARRLMSERTPTMSHSVFLYCSEVHMFYAVTEVCGSCRGIFVPSGRCSRQRRWAASRQRRVISRPPEGLCTGSPEQVRTPGKSQICDTKPTNTTCYIIALTKSHYSSLCI